MRCCWCGVSRQDLVCKYPAGLVEGVRGAPALVVEFLPGASAALVQGVAGEVYDVEGVHDCLCVGEFFGGCADDERPAQWGVFNCMCIRLLV